MSAIFSIASGTDEILMKYDWIMPTIVAKQPPKDNFGTAFRYQGDGQGNYGIWARSVDVLKLMKHQRKVIYCPMEIRTGKAATGHRFGGPGPVTSSSG